MTNWRPAPHRRWHLALVAVAAWGAFACGPVASPPGAQRDLAPAAALGAAGRTLVLVTRTDPVSLGAVRAQGAGSAGREVARLFYATLDFADERGTPHPYLAEALPVLNTERWRLLPDGRMETTYRLRADLTWQDGTPLVAEDFAFAGRVYAAPALGVAGSPPLSQLESVVARDERTLVLSWLGPYPEAAALLEGFQPLPRHLLQGSFLDGDMDAFANHPYWTFQYVGLGPYRLERWEPGALLEASAFEHHALGSPRIPRVRVLFIPDSNAAVATFLSGAAHVLVDGIANEDVPTVVGEGSIVLGSPLGFRITQIQFRPEMGALPELQDVRVRAALAHGIDKHGINEGLLGGHAVVTDSLISPLSDLYPAVEPAIVKRPYDPRRAELLLQEAGLSRGADGFYGPGGGESLRLEVRTTTASAYFEKETAIVVEGFRLLGLNAVAYLFPVALIRDNQAVTTFPALFSTGRTGGIAGLSDYSIASIPRAENRWLGGNRGGWVNAEYDRLWQAYTTTLDSGVRTQQIVQMEKAASEQVAAIPHYYTPALLVHAPNLRGPVARIDKDAGVLVHVHEWEWVS